MMHISMPVKSNYYKKLYKKRKLKKGIKCIIAFPHLHSLMPSLQLQAAASRQYEMYLLRQRCGLPPLKTTPTQFQIFDAMSDQEKKVQSNQRNQRQFRS